MPVDGESFPLRADMVLKALGFDAEDFHSGEGTVGADETLRMKTQHFLRVP